MQSQWQGYRLAARYEIQEQLGEGGMSSVYRAFDHNLRRTVAVKMIHPHLATDPEFLRRFEVEARAVAQLQHANIMQVYDFAREGEIYYMVLEYIPGDTLQAILKRLNEEGKRLSHAEIFKLLIPLCDAVDYAHEHEMIHRDIKPGNIMLDAKARPVLTDFGLARMLAASQHTRTGSVLGTALYMAPEQVRGEHVERSADIYALGIILFELLTGHPPYQGQNISDIMWMHVEEPIPSILAERPELPSEIEDIIRRALAKDIEDRYLSAQALKQDLETAADVLLAGSDSQKNTQPKADADQATLIENPVNEHDTLVESLSAPRPVESDANLASLVQESARARQPQGLYHLAAFESGLLSLVFSALGYIFHWRWAFVFAGLGWLVSLIIWLWAFPAWMRLSRAYRLVLVKSERKSGGSSKSFSQPLRQMPRLDYPHDIELMAAPAALAALILSTLTLAVGFLPDSPALVTPLVILWVAAYLLIFFFNLRFLALNFLQPGVLERFHFGHFLQTITYVLIALPGMAIVPLLTDRFADLALILSLAAFAVGGILGALVVTFLFQRILTVGLPTPALSPLVFSIAPLVAAYTLFVLFLVSYLQGQGVYLPPIFSRLIVLMALGLILTGEGLAIMLFIGYARAQIPRTPLWWGLVDPFVGVATISIAANVFGIEGQFFPILAGLTASGGVLVYLFVGWYLRRNLR